MLKTLVPALSGTAKEMNAVEGKSLITLQTCTLPDYEKRLIVQGELVEKGT